MRAASPLGRRQGPVMAGASVWTGRQLPVFGGQPLTDKTTPGQAAALYDPASGRWAVTATRPGLLADPGTLRITRFAP